jgi:cytochrome P450
MARNMLEGDALLPSERTEFDMIKDLTGVAYLAGSDTTVAAVHCYFLAMLIWPDIQAKAQVEVDRIVGKGRLPDFDDRPQMPYVQAVINECLRWIPVIPMCESPFSIFLFGQINRTDQHVKLSHMP